MTIQETWAIAMQGFRALRKHVTIIGLFVVVVCVYAHHAIGLETALFCPLMYPLVRLCDMQGMRLENTCQRLEQGRMRVRHRGLLQGA